MRYSATGLATVLLWASVFFSVPMFMGYGRGEFGAAFALLSLGLSLVSKKNLKVDQRVAMASLATFLLSLASALTAYAIDIAINVMIISFLVCAAAMLIVDGRPDVVLQTSRVILRVVVYLGVITSVLLFTGFTPEQLIIAEFAVADRGDEFLVAVLLPGGTNPFWMTTPYGVFHRATFWCIEPGVAVFILTLWRTLDRSKTRAGNIFKDAVFALALVSTFSTTAPIALGLYYFSKLYVARGAFSFKANILAAMVVAGSAYIFLYFPAFGFYEKMITHGGSFEARIDWYTSDSGALSRTIAIGLVAVHLAAMHMVIGRTAFLIAPIAFVTSVLNVVEFTALYAFGVLLMFPAPRPDGAATRRLAHRRRSRRIVPQPALMLKIRAGFTT